MHVKLRSTNQIKKSTIHKEQILRNLKEHMKSYTMNTL